MLYFPNIIFFILISLEKKPLLMLALGRLNYIEILNGPCPKLSSIYIYVVLQKSINIIGIRLSSMGIFVWKLNF